MNKLYHSIHKILLILFFLFIPNILIAQDMTEKNVIIGEEFSISMENDNDNGNWELYIYDSDLLELIEDRKNSPLKTTLIFFPKKEGNGDIVLSYIKDNSSIKEHIFKIYINKDNKNDNNPVNNTIDNSDNLLKEDYDIEKQISFIKALIERELYEEALSKINQIKENFVGGVLPKDLLMLEGECLSNIDNPDYDKAINNLKNYLESVYLLEIYQEETADVHLKIALLYFSNNDYKESEYNYVEIITLYIDYENIVAQAYLGLSDIYLKTKKYKDAIDDLESGLKLTSIEDWVLQELLIRLARIYFEIENFKDYDLSYKYYSILDILFPEGKYKEEVKERLNYLYTNFINYGD